MITTYIFSWLLVPVNSLSGINDLSGSLKNENSKMQKSWQKKSAEYIESIQYIL